MTVYVHGCSVSLSSVSLIACDLGIFGFSHCICFFVKPLLCLHGIGDVLVVRRVLVIVLNKLVTVLST